MTYTLDVFINGKYEPINFDDIEIKACAPVNTEIFEIAWFNKLSKKIQFNYVKGNYNEFVQDWFKDRFKKTRLI